MTKRTHQVSVLLVVLVLAGCTRAAPPAAVSSLRLPRLAAPDHYALVITPNLAAATFTGEETIDIRVLERTSRIVLHAAEITFGRVTVEAGGRTQVAVVTLDAEAETATLAVEQPLSPGPARVGISYTGILNGQLRGLYLSEANGRRYAVTQLEATDARRMYPSFDEPAMKATFDLTAVIDLADHAISNGVVRSDTPGPGAGKHTVTFSTTPKMSSYLVALVVGDFECVSGGADGIPIRICATPDKKALTGMALRDAEALMRFYNQYFSIKYPYGKLDVVAVPDFSAGAMENTAAIFYRKRVRAEGGLEHAWPLIRDRWSDVARKVSPFFGMTGVIGSLGAGCDAGTAAEIRTFFQTHKPAGAERTLQQALERIESCAALARAQTSALGTHLEGT